MEIAVEENRERERTGKKWWPYEIEDDNNMRITAR